MALRPAAKSSEIYRAGALHRLAALGAGIGAAYAGRRLMQLMRRLRATNAVLAERERRYRTLFECVADGFALVEGVWAPDGRLADYIVREVNPAMLRILNADRSLIGKRESELLIDAPATWLQACETALLGDPVNFEYHAPQSGRWFDIRLSKVGRNHLAQFVLDITDRKLAEQRHTELFDELNHRVKNNLALVSSMLSLQGRLADQPEVREHLAKAIDRIQAIADVHASLYRTSSKDEVDFAAYLRDLCDRLAGSLVDDDRIRINIQAEEAALPLDKAVSLGVIVNELVTNAAKHAFPAPARGEISIALKNLPEGLNVSVGDSGCGLPDAPPPQGLGMRLVRSLVQQLGGELDVEHQPSAVFTVRLAPPPPPALESRQDTLF